MATRRIPVVIVVNGMSLEKHLQTLHVKGEREEMREKDDGPIGVKLSFHMAFNGLRMENRT
jgi:hypothetical protein